MQLHLSKKCYSFPKAVVSIQDCEVKVARSWKFLGGVGFLRTLKVGVGIECFYPTQEVQLNNFLCRTPMLW